MGWSGKLTRCAWQLLIAVGFALGCGHAERSGNQQPGTPPMSCVVDDAVYSHGYVISSDACRTCTCLDGSVVCKDVCGPRDCVIEGTTYKPGERFVDRDGCYDCTCQADGSLNCTLVGCRTCGSVERDLAVALREAESCDPLNNDCSELVVTKLGCSCQGLVNTANSAALEKMRRKFRDDSAEGAS